IALSENPDDGYPEATDGMNGTFLVKKSDKTGVDFRAKGRLVNTGNHYLAHAGTGEIFLKGGADSPENFLGYREFDGTWYGGNNQQRSGEDSPNAGLHTYEPHIRDWKEGDPQWQGGKGKGMIGALNYLSSKGMNSVYFLTMNILGDGDDVWPYTDRNERYRFDCSKLDQWEIVFSHMDSLGIMMHVVLQETENELLLDAGYLDVQRKLYLRELVARFSHHNAITWNLGEEHGPVNWSPYGQTVDDTKKMANYLRKTDPYNHLVVVHTHSNENQRNQDMAEYIGHKTIDGPSLQCGSPFNVHRTTLKWVKESAKTGHNWVVCIDEIGQHWKGAMPDEFDPAHDTIRQQVLWGNLMAGGAGVEWYFGYHYPHGDLNCEDWRSRDILWDQTRYAVEFFREHLPFSEMENRDDLVTKGYCLAKPGEMYAVYYLGNGITPVDLQDKTGEFEIQWYNPRLGGALQPGSIAEVVAGRKVHPGNPPGGENGSDWLCLLTKK
ncbi:MAG: putative collagen-binding domain-containing protein, partial [Bacteroidales bacterium]